MSIKSKNENLLGHIFNSYDNLFSKNGLGRTNQRPFVVVSQRDDRLVLVKLHSLNKEKLTPVEYASRLKKIRDGKWHIVYDKSGTARAAETKLIDSYHVPIKKNDPQLMKQNYTLEKDSFYSLIRAIFGRSHNGQSYSRTTIREFHYRKK